MAGEKNIRKELEKFKKRLSKKVDIDRIIFFGSMAKGHQHKYSDIDLIIVSKKFRGVEFRRRALGFHKYWNLDFPFDFLCYTPEEFNRMSKGITMVKEAVKEGIVI